MKLQFLGTTKKCPSSFKTVKCCGIPWDTCVWTSRLIMLLEMKGIELTRLYLYIYTNISIPIYIYKSIYIYNYIMYIYISYYYTRTYIYIGNWWKLTHESASQTAFYAPFGSTNIATFGMISLGKSVGIWCVLCWKWYVKHPTRSCVLVYLYTMYLSPMYYI